jgi:phosphomannomutase
MTNSDFLQFHQHSTFYPELMQKAVGEHNADIGIALDGDGDRVIVVDKKVQWLIEIT